MQSGRRPGFISGTTTFSYVLILALPLSVSIRAIGETSVLTAGFGSWNSVANWNPASVPNSVGASAVFNGAATADNPAQAGNRTLTLDAAITVGSITVNNDLSTFTTTISTGTGGSLTFDAANGGPASINLPGGGGTGSATISAPMIFSDPVVATVNHVSSSSA